MTAAPDTNTASKPDTQWLEPLFKGRVARRYDVLIGLWVAAALFFWTWWLQPYHMSTGLQFWVATLALAWLFVLPVYFMVIFRRAKSPTADPPDPATVRVAMIVTKTPSEPFAILENTLRAMLSQTYPCDVWLADEDPQPETVNWCRAHGVNISSRHGSKDYHQPVWPRRTRCKEGNLAYFYDHFGYDRYDFVSQLDADHVPEPTYLEYIMRGFADPSVGYVTAPSICANNAAESWAARTRLDAEAAFHGVFQSGYTAALAPMCIGSHYAVRTKALKDVGGLGPELAEDHSTTMIMNAGGWRGVHAIDAIAVGDGPATVADLCIQEFQWSRSLFTLFLQYTPRYYSKLSPRLKFLFLFCQLFYPMMASFMALLYLIPIAALLFDVHYAEVTYPEFVVHVLPQLVMLTVVVWFVRRDGLFRPYNAKVLSWEKILFLGIQWPWVFWGCLMALRDRITGSFVDFRITPKGSAAEAVLPIRLVAIYACLALGSFLPILLADNVVNARGFYLFSAINGILYTIITCVIVGHHFRTVGLLKAVQHVTDFAKVAMPILLISTGAASLSVRGTEGLAALSKGLEPYRLVREIHTVSGAGIGSGQGTVFVFDPGWIPGGPAN